ncbi:PREDICTED: F-box protein At4g02760 [Tarenaya hassleriana]|uniref:F-box protein At4g02760 n=1 Tax=Tarenaya hassleriana TaxID=28532 RepID=UPI00053CA8B7|nr:PREDICTED: F-box protein At4g02760 [Tarenaya hassleriana]
MDDALPSFSAKRRCPLSASSTSPSSSTTLNPSMFSNRVDQLLVSFLARAESPSFPLSLDCSFDRVLASAAVLSGGNADDNGIINCARNLGSLLIESADRCYRKRATVHNSITWPLSHDLTTRVFAMLDTRTLLRAAATCSMFLKCAMDPFSYAAIDLTSHAPKVNNAVVSTMIQRAGSSLRSLKLGFLRSSSGPPLSHKHRVCLPKNLAPDLPILTRTCLNPLWTENGAVGKLLRRLHIYNIDLMDATSLCCALSACQNLTDLKIAGFYGELDQVLEAVTRCCPLIVRLFFDVWRLGCSFEASLCKDFVANCNDLSSLALRGFDLEDTEARIFLEGFHKLKCLDLSESSVTGSFLRELGDRRRDCVLETLILRDCLELMEEEVVEFLTSVLEGDFKFIRHINVSNCDGLDTEDGWRSCPPDLPLEKLKEERPEIRIVADFPPSINGGLDDMDTTTSGSSSSSSSGSGSGMETEYEEDSSSDSNNSGR